MFIGLSKPCHAAACLSIGLMFHFQAEDIHPGHQTRTARMVRQRRDECNGLRVAAANLCGESSD
jgi:hypothetical protein